MWHTQKRHLAHPYFWGHRECEHTLVSCLLLEFALIFTKSVSACPLPLQIARYYIQLWCNAILKTRTSGWSPLVVEYSPHLYKKATPKKQIKTITFLCSCLRDQSYYINVLCKLFLHKTTVSLLTIFNCTKKTWIYTNKHSIVQQW